MYVRIVTFHLDGITHDQYEQHCDEIAEAFNTWPGLLAKVWLSERNTNRYGGVYLFESKAAADLSRSSDLYIGMTANPGFANLAVDEYHTLGTPTSVTTLQLTQVSSPAASSGTW